MKRFVFSAGIVTAAIIATGSDSRGDGSVPSVTSAQSSARTKFMLEVTPAVKSFKDRCNTDVTVTTDFQNYDRAAVRAAAMKNDGRTRPPSPSQEEEYDDDALRQLGMRCAAAVSAASTYCTTRKTAPVDRDAPKGQKPKAPAVTGPDVNEVKCLFAGYSPRQKEPSEDFVQRNMSFASGVLTIRNSVEMGNVEENAKSTLRPPKLTESGRKNGAVCSTRDQCTSFACVEGSCKACDSTVACAAGWSCYAREGRCEKDRGPSTVDASDSSSSSSSSSKPSAAKPSPKANGASCAHDADCASKICGTISSPGGNHKCGSKR